MNTTHTLEIQMDGLLLNFIMLIWQCCGYFSGIRLNGGTRTPSTMSIASTTTSHGSVDWQSTEVNKDGKTFKQSVVFHFLSNNLHLRIFSLGVFILIFFYEFWYVNSEILVMYLRDTWYVTSEILVAINLMSSEDFPENVGKSHHCKNLKFKNFGESQLKLVSPWLI